MPTKKTTTKKTSTTPKSAAKKTTSAKKEAPKVPAAEKTAASEATLPKRKAPAKPKAVAKASRNGNGQARPVLTEEEIAVAAYFRYEKRVASGEPRDEIADWHAACEELGVAV